MTSIPEGWLPDSPGSFLCANYQLGVVRGVAIEELLGLGWKGIVIDPRPHMIEGLRSSSLGQSYGGSALLTLCAAIDLQARRIVPAGGDLAAGIHPNELYPLFVGAEPPLPQPRVALVGGSDALNVLKVLNEWVEGIAAFELAVESQEEAKEAGAWLGAGWRISQVKELTVWARKLLR